MNESITRGAHHVGLTVPDLSATRLFFTETLGFEQVGEIPDYPAAFLSDSSTMITLWQAEHPPTAIAFDRKNVIGLHHLALLVENHTALDMLCGKLKSAGNVDIEFEPEPLGANGVRHMMTNIPGGIRVEFLSPGA